MLKNIHRELAILPHYHPGKISSITLELIHSRVVIETHEQLVRPLTIICNTSLSEGMVPDSRKEAEVVSIVNKGKRDDTGKYRPVSLPLI